MLPSSPGDEHHDDDDRCNQYRIAQIRLLQDQETNHADNTHEWHKTEPETFYLFLFSRQEISGVNEYGQFGELRWLKINRTDAKPAPGTKARFTDMRNKNQHQED